MFLTFTAFIQQNTKFNVDSWSTCAAFSNSYGLKPVLAKDGRILMIYREKNSMFTRAQPCLVYRTAQNDKGRLESYFVNFEMLELLLGRSIDFAMIPGVFHNAFKQILLLKL